MEHVGVVFSLILTSGHRKHVVYCGLSPVSQEPGFSKPLVGSLSLGGWRTAGLGPAGQLPREDRRIGPHGETAATGAGELLWSQK